MAGHGEKLGEWSQTGQSWQQLAVSWRNLREVEVDWSKVGATGSKLELGSRSLPASMPCGATND